MDPKRPLSDSYRPVVTDKFRDATKPIEFPCPICRCTLGPMDCDQDRSVELKFAETSIRRVKPEADLEYRACLFGYCTRHGHFSLLVSSYGSPNYQDVFAVRDQSIAMLTRLKEQIDKLLEASKKELND